MLIDDTDIDDNVRQPKNTVPGAWAMVESCDVAELLLASLDAGVPHGARRVAMVESCDVAELLLASLDAGARSPAMSMAAASQLQGRGSNNNLHIEMERSLKKRRGNFDRERESTCTYSSFQLARRRDGVAVLVASDQSASRFPSTRACLLLGRGHGPE
uniref:Uncharacterized protein n=1 Tax=Oryza barthii TaxID=65489 RepID=A0A0D3HCP5_9ORYZ